MNVKWLIYEHCDARFRITQRMAHAFVSSRYADCLVRICCKKHGVSNRYSDPPKMATEADENYPKCAHCQKKVKALAL